MFVKTLVFTTSIKEIRWFNKSFELRRRNKSSGNAFVSGAGGLRFKSLAGQIGHSVANGSSPLRHFFKKSCVARAQ